MAQLLDIHTHLHSTAWNSVYSLRLGVDSSTPPAPYSAAIHPWDCEVLWPLREELLALLEGLPVIAVGETGIDNVAKVDRDKQAEIFCRQLQIAHRRQLPVILHSVHSVGEVLRRLRAEQVERAVFHGFTGNYLSAAEILSAGFFISFGERSLHSPKTVDTLGRMPVDRLFLESDESNAPIEELYAAVAAIRHIPPKELTEAVEQNYNRLFR